MEAYDVLVGLESPPEDGRGEHSGIYPGICKAKLCPIRLSEIITVVKSKILKLTGIASGSAKKI